MAEEKVYEDKTFVLTAEQHKKYDEWRKEKNKTKGEVCMLVPLVVPIPFVSLQLGWVIWS